ncbi:hypothetical protein [Antribacter gilvus]|uniref:hypothetical protein n=1 Tax=Antribacter gilvus TaxID=2304675 RepID=UPI000F77F09C|nr:hypothetical protein [Antribacter gilvus]
MVPSLTTRGGVGVGLWVEADVALDVDGRAVPGVRMPALPTSLGPVGGMAARLGPDTLVVIHDAPSDATVAVRVVRTCPANTPGSF